MKSTPPRSARTRSSRSAAPPSASTPPPAGPRRSRSSRPSRTRSPPGAELCESGEGGAGRRPRHRRRPGRGGARRSRRGWTGSRPRPGASRPSSRGVTPRVIGRGQSSLTAYTPHPRRSSSAGQSNRLVSGRSSVRIRPPALAEYGCTPSFRFIASRRCWVRPSNYPVLVTIR